MEINTEMLVSLLWFVIGVAVGIGIMVKVNAKQDNKLITNLLELEDNMAEYNNVVNELRVKLRITETRLKAYELTEQARVINGVNQFSMENKYQHIIDIISPKECTTVSKPKSDWRVKVYPPPFIWVNKETLKSKRKYGKR